MPEALLLALALLLATCGMGLLALSMKPHWDQANAPRPYPESRAWQLRGLGGLALGSALVPCVAADQALLASLVWVMGSTVAALLVALTLAFRPRWLGWLGAWLR